MQQVNVRLDFTFEFFEQNSNLFEPPGNSFDIRPLELQVCTPYMAEAGDLGLEIPSELLEGDFVVGVGRHWENTRGLRQTEIDQLFGQFG